MKYLGSGETLACSTNIPELTGGSNPTNFMLGGPDVDAGWLLGQRLQNTVNLLLQREKESLMPEPGVSLDEHGISDALSLLFGRLVEVRIVKSIPDMLSLVHHRAPPATRSSNP